jgi:hypothetical protein
MTIQNNPTRNQYTATSGQTVFNYNFEIISTGDISVFKGDTRLAISTDYTLTGVGNESGGTVTLVVGATTGDIITIYRSTAQERLTDYQNSGDFLSDEVNSDFDRIWAVIQEIDGGQGRYLQLSDTTTASLPVTLDDPIASQILRWKDDSSGVESVSLSTISPGSSVATDFCIYKTNYNAVRSIDVSEVVDGQALTVTDEGIGGQGVLRNVVGHGVTDNGGTIIVIDANWYWERIDSGGNTANIATNTANIALKANLTGAAFTGPVSNTAGDVNLKTNTDLSDASATLTAAQLIGGEFTITPTVARIQTTDTAANIIAALTGSVDNSNFETTIVNLAAFDVTLAAGTGVTLVGNMTVNNGSATFRVRRLTSSTVSITRLETGSGPLIYTSPDQTITSGGTLTLTHGLGVRPTDIKAQLICAVANNNYPIGAVLPISTGYQGDNTANNRTMSLWTENDTEIDISFGSTSNTFIIIHATSGARVLITNTYWRLRIIAKEY